MLSDDLTPLFRPAGGDGPFRQGEVLTFDAATGANTIAVGGAVLTDLPLLELSGVVNLEPGDVVILMTFRGSWAILGRVQGGAGFAAAASESKSVYVSTSNFALSTSFVIRASTTLTVPAWSNRCTFILTGGVAALNNGGATDILDGYVQVAAQVSITPYISLVNGAYGSISMTLASAIGVIPGDTLYPELYAASTSAAWSAVGTNRAVLSGVFIFTRV